VTVYNRDKTGVLTGLSAITDSPSGTYSIAAIPPGLVTVAAFGNGEARGGSSRAFVNPGSPTQVDVFPFNGDIVKFDDTIASSGATFRLQCDGSISGSGSGGRFEWSRLALLRPAGGPALAEFPCLPFAGTAFNSRSRSLDAGYLDAVGLEVSRQLYVSPSGDFARYLEVLTNQSSVDVRVRVRISGAVANSSPLLIRDPASTSNTYAVYNEGSAALGLVFAGENALVPAAVRATNGNPRYSYEWVVTVPAGETRRLMHFALQGQPGNLDATTAAAAALALGGAIGVAEMNNEEKASVVNFRIF
jgi:hypothetical protein